MKTTAIHSQLTACAMATAISLTLASLAGAETVRVKIPAAKAGPAPVRVVVTPPQISDQRALELQNAQRARKMAEVKRMAQELRNNAAGSAPGLRDQIGGAPRRSTGSAADRAGQLTPPSVPGTDYRNPLGPASAGIDARLRGNAPRSKVVGPGGVPTDSTSLASHDPQTTTYQTFDVPGYGSVDTMTSTSRDPRTGATVFGYRVGYQTGSGRLAGWGTATVDAMGNVEETGMGEVKYAGPNTDIPVVTVTTWDSATGKEVSVNRPYNPETDPPIDKPKTFGPAIMPAEDGTGDPRFRGPMGMEYNPLTGQWSAGMKLGNNHVKPGCEAALPRGQRLRIDQKAIVVNPDPDALRGAAAPARIDRSGKGPGQRPPSDPNRPTN